MALYFRFLEYRVVFFLVVGIATIVTCAVVALHDGDGHRSLRTRQLRTGVDDDDEYTNDDQDNYDDNIQADDNEIIFVAIIASILICGCGCLSGNCGTDGGRNTIHQPLTEPLLSRNEQRMDIFSNSLGADENEWLCPVCAFENRPRAQSCTLCGSSQETASKYYNAMRRQRRGIAEGNAEDDDDESTFRVTLVAPPGRDSDSSDILEPSNRVSLLGAQASPGNNVRGREAGLTHEERQEAFMIRRFNALTLRQRAAHRRKMWQRQPNVDTGALEWVRVVIPAASGADNDANHGTAQKSTHGQGDGDDGQHGPAEEGAGASLLKEQSEDANQWGGTHNALLPRDSFGDSAHMSYSPGFASVLDTSVSGKIGWQEVSAVTTESVGPIKAKILSAPATASEEATSSMRSSVPVLEIENESDLATIAALPFRRKQQWLQSCLDALRGTDIIGGPSGAGVVKLHIRRDHILADSFNQLMSIDPQLLSRRLRIVFKDEPGIDAGGLLREFYLLTTQQLFDPLCGLFVNAGNDGGYSINPISGLCNSLHLKYFRFAGRYIGKALLEHQTLPAHLSLPLLKHILSVPISFSDLEFEDGELYQNLVFLRDNQGAENLDLDFTVEVEHLGMRQTHELMPGGAKVAVTDANKHDYLRRRFKFRMLDSISEQLWQLLCGLYEVVPKEALSVFDYQELELLISGVPEIDLNDWKRHSRYVGLYKKTGPKHPVVKWFWEVLESFNHEERARLLQFTTGSSRLPAQGFKALEANDGNFRLFTVAGVDKKDFLYPRSHTCFNRIDLPIYDSKEELEGYLSLVINMEITGFSDE